jgi:hypothetical protein
VERGELVTVVLQSEDGTRLWAREIGITLGGFSDYELDATFDCSDGTLREILPPTSTSEVDSVAGTDSGSGAAWVVGLLVAAGAFVATVRRLNLRIAER